MPTSMHITESSYGKTGVRLVKVERNKTRHEMKDMTVAIQLSGDFEQAYSEGDNRQLLPTDTMKNTVYVLASQSPIGEIEGFATRLTSHFLERHPQIVRVRVNISEKIWLGIGSNGSPKDSFQMVGPECRTVSVDSTRAAASVEAGIANLVVLKTGRSAFADFLKDEYTTLKETHDRLLSSSVNAQWIYGALGHDAKTPWRAVRQTLLDIFAQHNSLSVQHTLYAMGQGVLDRFSCIDKISLSMSNRHCIPIDLTPFKLDNPNEVFVPVDEPSGLIEAVLKRAA
jgi:urate oxidase